jgi:hypothetical protein
MYAGLRMGTGIGDMQNLVSLCSLYPSLIPIPGSHAVFLSRMALKVYMTGLLEMPVSCFDQKNLYHSYKLKRKSHEKVDDIWP